MVFSGRPVVRHFIRLQPERLDCSSRLSIIFGVAPRLRTLTSNLSRGNSSENLFDGQHAGARVGKERAGRGDHLKKSRTRGLTVDERVKLSPGEGTARNPLASLFMDFAGVRATVTARGNDAIIQERVGRSQVPL